MSVQDSVDNIDAELWEEAESKDSDDVLSDSYLRAVAASGFIEIDLTLPTLSFDPFSVAIKLINGIISRVQNASHCRTRARALGVVLESSREMCELFMNLVKSSKHVSEVSANEVNKHLWTSLHKATKEMHLLILEAAKLMSVILKMTWSWLYKGADTRNKLTTIIDALEKANSKCLQLHQMHSGSIVMETKEAIDKLIMLSPAPAPVAVDDQNQSNQQTMESLRELIEDLTNTFEQVGSSLKSLGELLLSCQDAQALVDLSSVEEHQYILGKRKLASELKCPHSEEQLQRAERRLGEASVLQQKIKITESAIRDLESYKRLIDAEKASLAMYKENLRVYNEDLAQIDINRQDYLGLQTGMKLWIDTTKGKLRAVMEQKFQACMQIGAIQELFVQNNFHGRGCAGRINCLKSIIIPNVKADILNKRDIVAAITNHCERLISNEAMLKSELSEQFQKMKITIEDVVKPISTDMAAMAQAAQQQANAQAHDDVQQLIESTMQRLNKLSENVIGMRRNIEPVIVNLSGNADKVTETSSICMPDAPIANPSTIPRKSVRHSQNRAQPFS